MSVMSDRDANVDFSTYKTLEYYGWADNSDRILNDIDKNRIEVSFGTEFLNRGLTLAEKGKGDIIVSLYIVTERKEETVANTNTNYMGGGYGRYYGYGPGYGWGGGHAMSTTTYSKREYNVGTLVVSVYDAQKQELVWEAIGSKTINENSKDPDKDIQDAVARIMKEYPIEPKK